jgi:hypothetical protein
MRAVIAGLRALSRMRAQLKELLPVKVWRGDCTDKWVPAVAERRGVGREERTTITHLIARRNAMKSNFRQWAAKFGFALILALVACSVTYPRD